MCVNVYNSGAQEVEAGESVQGHPDYIISLGSAWSTWERKDERKAERRREGEEMREKERKKEKNTQRMGCQ